MRTEKEIVKNIQKLLDELLHNYAINTILERSDDFEEYIVKRVYECVYEQDIDY